MSFRDLNEKYGPVFLITSSLVVGLVILLLFKVYGYDETWKLWRVPVQYPQFADFRLIPGSAESYREKGRFSPSNPPKRGKEKAWAYPVLANGRLYIREQNSLWCYDVKAGQ